MSTAAVPDRFPSRGTAAELETWLTERGVSVDQWGTGGYKSVARLADEVTKGESRLEVKDGVVSRLVEVLTLAVWPPEDPGLLLYEVRQILPDGRIRERNVVLSEKLVVGEFWQHAVQRAIEEELGPAINGWLEVDLDESSYSRTETVEDARSYPGVRCTYIVHRARCMVGGLPAETFDTVESRPEEGGTLTTVWEWRRVQHLNGAGPVQIP
ncbi:unnamed protein product [Pedinophyceae sp. YPF-701]|nr:unnamed protein product [Pedinophyceae sp. YPF-701]